MVEFYSGNFDRYELDTFQAGYFKIEKREKKNPREVDVKLSHENSIFSQRNNVATELVSRCQISFLKLIFLEFPQFEYSEGTRE